MHSANINKITLLGGEPLLCNDLISHITKFAEGNIEVGIISNGFLLNKNYIELLKNSGCSEITLSMYGANSAEHDYITKTPGSYSRIIALIKKYSAKIKFRINFILMKHNLHNISMQSFHDSLGDLEVENIRFMTCLPGERKIKLTPDLDVYKKAVQQILTCKIDQRVTFTTYFNFLSDSTSCKYHIDSVPAYDVYGNFYRCCMLSSLKRTNIINGTNIINSETLCAGEVSNPNTGCPFRELKFEN
jgi:sulfatase maturation enzyme AslB (radical SAM superfamily)